MEFCVFLCLWLCRKTQVKEKRPCEEENQSSTAASVKGNRPCVDLTSSASAAAAAAPASGTVEEQEVALMEIRMPDYAVMTDFEDDDKEAGGFLHKYQGGHLVVVGKFPKVILEGPLNPNALTVEGILQWLKGEEEDVYPADDPYGRAHWGIFSEPSSPTASASGKQHLPSFYLFSFLHQS
ncbi:hypothetical protein HanHA300_Chr00c1065g0837031 [Helianthus annuus]|nr:hypothetical protein HanHA300_Chr00c1065g0837031 [Helianthus annuus]